MILQSNATENIASDEMYNISKKMLTVNLSSLIGLQHKQWQDNSCACLRNFTQRQISTRQQVPISPDVWKVVCLEVVGHKQA